MTKTVTASFRTRATTEEALRQLENAGFTDQQISVLMSDETRRNAFKFVENSKADEGFAAGSTFGGVVGAVLAAAAGAGVVVLPGLNLVVAGTVISGLAGLGAGAVTGGVVGALIGAGMTEHEAKHFDKELTSGGCLIAVEAETGEQADMARKIFKDLSASSIAA